MLRVGHSAELSRSHGEQSRTIKMQNYNSKSEIKKLENFSQFEEGVEKLNQNKAVGVEGLVPGAKAFWLAGIENFGGGRILLISSSIEEAEKTAQDIKFFSARGTFNFPAWEILPKEKILPHKDIIGEQLRILKLLTGESPAAGQIFVTSPKSFYHKLISPPQFNRLSLEIFSGKEYDLGNILKKLDQGGYIRFSLAEEKGNFSLRGGILDIFPLSEENPIRIEFFGEKIESIRYFDSLTQRSLKKVKSVFIPPAAIQGESNFFKFLSNIDLVILDEPVLIKAQLTESLWRELITFIKMKKKICLFAIRQSMPEIPIDSKFQIGTRAIDALWEDFSGFFPRLKKWQEENFKVSLVSQNEGEEGRLKELLKEKGLDLGKNISFSVSELNRGFLFPDLKLAVITDREIFHRYAERRPRQRFKGGLPLSTYRELEKGDLVVHLNHGIGKFQGIKKLKIEEGKKDFLAVEYQGGDILYVPIEQVRLVQKYIGSEGIAPKLYKLGGSAWFKVVKRTKRALRDMATELLDIYAKRETRPGFVFSEDSDWQKEFEASFIYEETPDQREAVEEVKKDMERARPMDRLVCGDVGYGKTEVAVRAAFKAATEGKQAAILVPTTILAQQHYYTFGDRMANYPIRIEMLSRFRTSEEQKVIIKELGAGKIDVIIGTHRLLQDDVKFKDLGLLVIDEEQRFGVAHKEKIKKIRELVDVLTLSATPIPRTLYMSLTGIRDLSVIETPPRDRLPIQTFILEYDEKIICGAIRREVERRGQVFFVFNRINYIHKAAGRLREFLPDLKIAVAHGRLQEKELEKVMRRFINGEIDVLVSTTIIESGLDIPNVNTIIIINAHRYGLADLYQLRGRVGRYKHRAYAYLFIPEGEIVSGEAIKRLKTMEEFTELGAGIRIAMRDLEIRGTGNILGHQQHGFITAVGFDLYCRLLRESVSELKGKILSAPRLETKVNLDVPEYIPDGYIPEARHKVEIYAKLSSLETIEELNDLKIELVDRFGPLKEGMETLLDLAEIRIQANHWGIERIYRQKEEGTFNFQFNPEYMPPLPEIEKLTKLAGNRLSFRQAQDNRLNLALEWKESDDKASLPLLKKLLQKE